MDDQLRDPAGASSRARAFCRAATALFLVRGLLFLSLFPLFEGWDEYQHVARIDFEAQHGRRPLIHETDVPASFLERLVDYPQSNVQLQTVGALGFQEFWDSTPVFTPTRRHVWMYEDQQAPLYYWLAAPLYSLAGGTPALLRSVTLLRLVNLLLGALAVHVALRSLCRLVRPVRGLQLLLLAASLHPLFLQNVARVANDALAVLLGTLVVAMTLLPPERESRWRPAALGALLGAAALAKSTNLMLVPFVGLVALLQASTRRRGAEAVILVAAGFLLLMGRELVFNVQHYGALTGLMTEIENRKQGHGLLDLLAAVPQVPWLWILRDRCLAGSLWQGGWSFLPLPDVLRLGYVAILAAGSAGWLWLVRRSNRPALMFTDPRTPLSLLLLGACALLGIAYFSVQCEAAGSKNPVVPWYVMVIVPWLTVLFHQGARLLPGAWLRTALPLALLLVYVGTELHGTLFVMLPHYTGHVDGATTWQRLAWLQSGFLGPWTALVALLVYLPLLAILLTLALRMAPARLVPHPEAPGDMP